VDGDFPSIKNRVKHVPYSFKIVKSTALIRLNQD
jgi:hypothetical protein